MGNIYNINNSKVAEIQGNGLVYDRVGNSLGKVIDGTVYDRSGSKAGWIDGNNVFSAQGTQVGWVESNGNVYNVSGQNIGKSEAPYAQGGAALLLLVQ